MTGERCVAHLLYFHLDKSPFHMTRMTRFSILFFSTIFSLSPAFCQSSEGQGTIWKVSRVSDFELNGQGSQPEWKTTEWVPLQKYKGTAPYETAAKLLYSETGVYGLFSCSDKKITATLKEDFADLFKEDVVEIFFWTDPGTRLYFEYELSPLNFELPILVPNFNGDFFGWRPWHYEGERKTRHKTHIGKDTQGNVTSWTAEFFVPYALLKPLTNVNPQKGTQWRINLYRIDYDDKYSSWTWQPVKGSFHEIESYGTLEFQ